MSHTFRATVMIAAAAGALTGMAGERLCAQGADPNVAPNPYKMQESWAQLGERPQIRRGYQGPGRPQRRQEHLGVRPLRGERMHEFDARADGEVRFLGQASEGIGAGMFDGPHGFYVDGEGNVWGGDQIAKNGKGADLIKFSPDGKVLMSLGKPGMPGNGPGYLTTGSAVVVAPNGDIYVADGHGEGTNDRIVKFSTDGKFITAWGKHGKGPGEFDTSHGIALDSRDASTSPTAPTTASRCSSRTASSLPNGSSSAGRATLQSIRTT